MKHTSHHVHILMSGHNPEHHHHSKKSHRGSDNARHHMHKHGEHNISHETKTTKPCDILMRQHHFHGGISSAPPTFSRGGKIHKHRRFATGGHVDHEESEREGHKKGGRARRHHHAFGGMAYGGIDKYGAPIGSKWQLKNMNHPPMSPEQIKSQYYGKPYKKGGHCYAEGGETKEYGEKPLTGQLRRGGRARHRHAEGETVSDHLSRKSGGRTRRQHHYWGQSVIGRLPLIGGIANSIANTAGTLDPNKYGGSEYVARTKGQKAADILSTIGNLGANLITSRGGKGAPAAKKRGGGVHHKHRQHHAAGGAGKVRKGMMTKSGHMIHHDI